MLFLFSVIVYNKFRSVNVWSVGDVFNYQNFQDYLKRVRMLEDKLSEAEQRLSEMQIGHDVESTEELAVNDYLIEFLDSF